MKSHTVHSFDKEMESIRDRMMAMGGFTEQQLSDALTALMTGDSFLAEMVIEKDKRLNRMELDIDNACIFLLARRTPVAFDLRLVVTMLKTINDLERIGDLAKEIAQSVPLFSEDVGNSNCLPLIEGMGERVKKRLHKGLDALARSDTQVAAELYKDDHQDGRHETILRHMLALVMKEPHNPPDVLHICRVTRALERIGDRCRNIAEYVIYLVEGKDVRHAESTRK
uniref:Phosphate-specific transport system accessory protein PhoU n=1 Tax=Candidatus Kentrum sp. LPFa TaxID=2126335 RepID=A0A450X3Y9_9GAMM|nr:MAG: phosphate uptake regulator, PhoU [Candidatus Kentron sp. LPFa]VFK19559.1 MAG: phosphate uptake regulator, PhoU [Candidatus Kentron sp. LPFa]VFK23985.1 MAG: phosphate uptake regulator, PhoU [Candidatus Kentron sp. LPFa]